jgi:hypothetical protein
MSVIIYVSYMTLQECMESEVFGLGVIKFLVAGHSGRAI